MNLKKAIEQLEALSKQDDLNLITYAQAHALLAGFHEENLNCKGMMKDVYSNEKIHTVQTGFQILCGIGEDGITHEQAKLSLSSDISSLAYIIDTDDEFSLDPPSAKIARFQQEENS